MRLPCPSCSRPLAPEPRLHRWVRAGVTMKGADGYDIHYWCEGCGLLRHDTGWGPVTSTYYQPGVGCVNQEPPCGPPGHRGVLINSIASANAGVIQERERLQQLLAVRGNKQTREQLKKMIEDSRRRLADLESRLVDLEGIRAESYGQGHPNRRGALGDGV